MDNEVIVGIIASTLAIIMLTAGVIMAFLIGNRKALEKEMQLAQRELDYERELRHAENEVSEQMMERFAREIHDNIGHSLTCIRIHVENKKLDNPEFEAVFSPIESYLTEAGTQLRSLSRSLNGDYLVNVGLEEAIAMEVDRLKSLKRQHIVFETVHPKIDLDKNQQLMIFRIFQEIINNALRHSKAKNIWITLNERSGFEMIVKDDGSGFDMGAVMASARASGVRNIINRTKLIGMHCTIETAPGAGCTTTIATITT